MEIFTNDLNPGCVHDLISHISFLNESKDRFRFADNETFTARISWKMYLAFLHTRGFYRQLNKAFSIHGKHFKSSSFVSWNKGNRRIEFPLSSSASWDNVIKRFLLPPLQLWGEFRDKFAFMSNTRFHCFLPAIWKLSVVEKMPFIACWMINGVSH